MDVRTTEMGFNLVLLKRGDLRGLPPLSSVSRSPFHSDFVRSGACSPDGAADFFRREKSGETGPDRARAVIEPP